MTPEPMYSIGQIMAVMAAFIFGLMIGCELGSTFTRRKKPVDTEPEEGRMADNPKRQFGGGLSRRSHDYLSTACYHGLHDRCRNKCKFCEVKCNCSCHKEPEEGVK